MKYIFIKIRRGVIDGLRYAIGYLFPTVKRKIFFDSLPDFSDNSRALSDYISQDDSYEIYWAVRDPQRYHSGKNIHFIDKESKLSYIYHTITSQYIFATHVSHNWANPHRQTSVCLWHGSPLKKIGLMQNSNDIGVMRHFKYFTSSSEHYVDIFKMCFGYNLNVINTGYARNDCLFQENDSLNQMGIHPKDGEKVVVYLPTFRDRMNVSSVTIIDVSNYDYLAMFNKYLLLKGIILIVKLHPADKTKICSSGFSNIKIYTDSDFRKYDIQLNSLLHNSDALITDYSSVFCDYLLLNRPIGFVTNDINEYNVERGFIYNNYLDMLPGRKIQSEADFKSFCDDISHNKDAFSHERKSISKLFNDFTDANNCKRICDAVGIIINNK